MLFFLYCGTDFMVVIRHLYEVTGHLHDRFSKHVYKHLPLKVECLREGYRLLGLLSNVLVLRNLVPCVA